MYPYYIASIISVALSASMPLLVLYNPVCGDGTAAKFFETEVLPLLRKHNKDASKVIATESAEHAGSTVAEFLTSHKEDVTVILGSGDGTLHDIINHLSSADLKGVTTEKPLPQLRLALVPCGTANALYSSFFPPTEGGDPVEHKLKSVQAFLSNSSTRPLTLAVTTLSSPPATKKRPEGVLSAVVVSTSLHAAILRDSERLRASIPGIDRFKVAAQENITVWYNSYVRLLPCAKAGVVQIYDPSKNEFVAHEDSDEDDPWVELVGPFAYFLATVNVDRLEPAFRIAPLHSTIPPTETSIDIVIVRPLRDPSVQMDSPELRTSFSTKLVNVLTSAYQDGAHVHLRYGPDGAVGTTGDGPYIVEYIRCGGWEWAPDDIDESAHTLCADGTIFNIEKQGRAVCVAATPNDSAGFMIYT